MADTTQRVAGRDGAPRGRAHRRHARDGRRAARRDARQQRHDAKQARRDARRGHRGRGGRPRGARASAPSQLDVALATLERRRRDRWIVAAVLVLAVVAALAVLLLDEAGVATAPWVAGAFAVVAVLYGVSVVVQERRARRAVRALIEERSHLAGLETRLLALEALHEVVREVVAADDLPTTFTRLVRGAIDLAGGYGGAVLLRVGDGLTVAAADGAGMPDVGERIPEDGDAAWEAVRSGEITVVDPALEWGSVAGRATLAVPLQLPAAHTSSRWRDTASTPDDTDEADDVPAGADARVRTVGVLVVERPADAPPFGAADRATVSLFAEHAALAVRNATRLDRLADEAEARARSDAELRERLAVEVVERVRLAEEAEARARLAEQAEARGQADADLRVRVERCLDDLRGTLASITGITQLLLHRGDAFPVGRRQALLEDVLEAAARQRDLLLSLLPDDHDPATHDPATHDPATHDPATHDLAAHDLATHDPATHDLAAHDLATHDLAAHDLAAQDLEAGLADRDDAPG